MASNRAEATQSAQAAVRGEPNSSTTPGGGESEQAVGGFIDPEAEVDAFNMQRVDRRGRNWGALRERRASDVAAGRGEVVAEDYRASVDAYFRALSERASESSRSGDDR